MINKMYNYFLLNRARLISVYNFLTGAYVLYSYAMNKAKETDNIHINSLNGNFLH